MHSVPRLMPGQSVILGVGSMDYPAEFQGTSQDTLNKLGISKVMTLTSTYDHRVIQGAASGEFLRQVANLLLGENGFYDEIFKALRIPYEPVRWLKDIDASHDDDVTKAARVFELIHSYRVRGHVMTTPTRWSTSRRNTDLNITEHGLTLWDLEREFAVGGFAGKSLMKLRDILGVLRDSSCRTTGGEFTHDPAPRISASAIQDRIEGVSHHARSPDLDASKQRILSATRRIIPSSTFPQPSTGCRPEIAKYSRREDRRARKEAQTGRLDAFIALDGRVPPGPAVGTDMAHHGRTRCAASRGRHSPTSPTVLESEGNRDPKSMHGSGDLKYHLRPPSAPSPAGRRADQPLAVRQPLARPRQGWKPRVVLLLVLVLVVQPGEPGGEALDGHLEVRVEVENVRSCSASHSKVTFSSPRRFSSSSMPRSVKYM
ncbi:hypothetical protein SVIOM342S_10449 [Streptomyces violaceorubidus]